LETPSKYVAARTLSRTDLAILAVAVAVAVRIRRTSAPRQMERRIPRVRNNASISRHVSDAVDAVANEARELCSGFELDRD